MRDFEVPPSVQALLAALRKIGLDQGEAAHFAERLIEDLRGKDPSRHDQLLRKRCEDFVTRLPAIDRSASGVGLAGQIFRTVSGGLLMAIGANLLPDAVKFTTDNLAALQFRFATDDVVFIGTGSCGDAALAAAAVAGATAIIMQRWLDWHGPGPVFAGPLPQRMLFDTGRTWSNRLVLSDLTRSHAGRAFLAGDIPRNTAFRPPPLVHAIHAFAGASPRQLDRLALEEMCRSHSQFKTTSLHDVYSFPACDPIPRTRRPSAEEAARIDRARADFLLSLFKLRAVGGRPAVDPVSRSRDAALAAHYLHVDRTVILRRWRAQLNHGRTVNPFDTAFLDAELAGRYAATGIQRIVVEPNILLLDIEGVRAVCASRDLDLVYTHG